MGQSIEEQTQRAAEADDGHRMMCLLLVVRPEPNQGILKSIKRGLHTLVHVHNYVNLRPNVPESVRKASQSGFQTPHRPIRPEHRRIVPGAWA